MKIEIKRNNVVEKTVKFPLIAENIDGRKGLIVFFLDCNDGIVLSKTNDMDTLGERCENWISPFDKTVWRILQEGEQLILSNTFE